MKKWLDKQKDQEKHMLEAVNIQVREVVEDLIPQIRLSALENEMMSDVRLNIHFEFNEKNTEIWSEGQVYFPPKQSVSTAFQIGYGSEKEKQDS
jgi:hypothetical protein